MMPSRCPSSSKSRNLLIPAARSARSSLVSNPCTVLAAAQRALPSAVFGPVDAPPWNRQVFFPRAAGARHCWPVRLDLAEHCKQQMRPPAVRNMDVGFDISGNSIEGVLLQ
jgi:hypothetical protein